MKYETKYYSWGMLHERPSGKRDLIVYTRNHLRVRILFYTVIVISMLGILTLVWPSLKNDLIHPPQNGIGWVFQSIMIVVWLTMILSPALVYMVTPRHKGFNYLLVRPEYMIATKQTVIQLEHESQDTQLAYNQLIDALWVMSDNPVESNRDRLLRAVDQYNEEVASKVGAEEYGLYGQIGLTD